MIHRINVDKSEMRMGEKRKLTVFGDSEMSVEIKCFVTDPPPPDYKPCPECGVFDVASGGSVTFCASSMGFGNRPGGSLEIVVRDATGDIETITLGVLAAAVQEG